MAEGYTVTDVHQRERFTVGGSRVSYYDISVVTDQGATGTLRIKSVDYDKAKVPAMLREFAQGLDLAFTI